MRQGNVGAAAQAVANRIGSAYSAGCLDSAVEVLLGAIIRAIDDVSHDQRPTLPASNDCKCVAAAIRWHWRWSKTATPLLPG
jgi:hypothetical protein